jgi:hypothetical protein
LISKLPAALQPPIADGGWEKMSEQNSAAFEIIAEEEYADKYSSKKTRESFIHMADSVTTTQNMSTLALHLDDKQWYSSALTNKKSPGFKGTVTPNRGKLK